MKKIYQIPETMVHIIAPATLIAESLPLDDDGGNDLGDGEILVKRDHGSNSSNYNVWNDDWSN